MVEDELGVAGEVAVAVAEFAGDVTDFAAETADKVGDVMEDGWEAASDFGEEAWDSVSSGFGLWGSIDDATVWFDTNNNGLFDSGESDTNTHADGSFTLVSPGVLDFSSGVVRLTGGVDTATGLPIQGVMSASSEGIVSPLTSLVQKLTEDGRTSTAAQNRVRSAFGISENVDLFEFNYVEETLNENPNARAVLVNANSVQGIVSGIHNLLAGASGGTIDTQDAATSFILSNAAFSALSELMDGSEVDLEDPTVLAGVIRSSIVNSQTLADELGINLGLNEQEVEDIIEAAAKLLAAGVTKKRLLAEESEDGIELLTRITQAKYVSHGEEATALNRLALGEMSVEEIEAIAEIDDAALEAIRQVKLNPQLAGMTDLNLAEGESVEDLTITLFDFETSFDDLEISITSDNPELLPAENVTLSPGELRHQALLSLSPLEGEGVVTLSISITDADGNTITESYTVAIGDGENEEETTEEEESTDEGESAGEEESDETEEGSADEGELSQEEESDETEEGS
ncbi:MAG: hypothetical protein ACP5D7_01725, partial [Limnospira sp.]